jgi:hypothetical protein
VRLSKESESSEDSTVKDQISLHEFVPDECPPDEASLPNSEVYRFVKEAPPLEWDFKSSIERNPQKNYDDNQCARAGLSVFYDLDDAKEARKAIPGMKSKHVAKGDLTPESGKVQHTPRTKSPSHHTWWKDTEFDAVACFESVSPPIK